MQSPEFTPGAPLPAVLTGGGDLILRPASPHCCHFVLSQSSKQLSHLAPDNFFKAINSIANDLNRDACKTVFSVRNRRFVPT
jgi:hypothetical protein